MGSKRQEKGKLDDVVLGRLSFLLVYVIINYSIKLSPRERKQQEKGRVRGG